MATFRAMNTDVSVVAPFATAIDAERMTGRVRAVFDDAERRFSRFRDDSEISALNRATAPFDASSTLIDVLELARAMAARTHGLFDPAIGAAMRAEGYDRSFERLSNRDSSSFVAPVRTRFDDLAIDADTRTVVRPAAMLIDLGGLVKGHTVDVAARLFEGTVAVDAGGDASLRGAGPDGRGWVVDIEDPRDASRVVLSVRVTDRAVATSAPNRRRWRVGGEWRHHLINPRTQRSAESDLAQVTVFAQTAAEADVFAKVVFILGRRAGSRFLRAQHACAGVLVQLDGEIECVGDLEVCDA